MKQFRHAVINKWIVHIYQNTLRASRTRLVHYATMIMSQSKLWLILRGTYDFNTSNSHKHVWVGLWYSITISHRLKKSTESSSQKKKKKKKGSYCGVYAQLEQHRLTGKTCLASTYVFGVLQKRSLYAAVSSWDEHYGNKTPLTFIPFHTNYGHRPYFFFVCQYLNSLNRTLKRV